VAPPRRVQELSEVVVVTAQLYRVQEHMRFASKMAFVAR
jgi:hypothetical protein